MWTQVLEIVARLLGRWLDQPKEPGGYDEAHRLKEKRDEVPRTTRDDLVDRLRDRKL